MGNRDRKYNFCGTTLLAGKSSRLITVPTHRLPVNAGNASEDTKASPFPPALCGPFAAPLFAPLSAPGTLCGCAIQLYFRFNGFVIKLCFLYTICDRLSSTNFHQRWTSGFPRGEAVKIGSSEPILTDEECGRRSYDLHIVSGLLHVDTARHPSSATR